MAYSIFSMLQRLRKLRRNQMGSAVVLAAVMIPTVVGVAGLSVDVGRLYAAKRALNAETQAAALAGAYSLAAPNATGSTATTAVTNWHAANSVSNVTITSSTATASCVTSTSGLPACNASSPNVVNVNRSGTVPTYFLKAVGRSSFTISSSASAAKAGGNAQALNVMFVLDATGSMDSKDTGCTVPGNRSPSRFECAQYSMQQILKVMPTSLDKAGLMIFPGPGTQYNPTSHPCSNQPNSVPYLSTTIYYQIGSGSTLSNNYNDGAGNLSNSSPLIQAIGNGSSLTGCVTPKGGQGSYAAEVLTKAQAALPVVAGTKNVIIFLSDGDFGATQSQLNGNSSKVAKQCGQAVTSAQAAATAGTTVYSVAYGAATSGGCSSGDTYNPCSTMKAIASDSSRFYSTTSACQITGSPNAISGLPGVFSAISTNLTKPRLILN